MNTLIKILIAIAFIAFFILIAKEGIARQEKVNCYKLQSQEEYKDFYITKLDNEMCFNHGIVINAVVK